MLDRLIANWVYGGFLAGLLLLALTPVITHSWSQPVALTFLCLPIYMLHQYEEHDNGRFGRFVNDRICKGRNGLSPWVIFLVNIPLVWGVIGLSFALAATVDCGFGLISVYLVGVNAAIHIVTAIIYRTYNPGLLTAVFLFVPLAVFAFHSMQQAGIGTLPMHILGVAVTIAIHAALVIHVMDRSGQRVA
ncbi:MAG: HXXEE domain-containing protein [Terracidiphilus sp.]